MNILKFKILFPVFLLTVIFGFAVFGPFLMGGEHQGGCPMAASQGIACPQSSPLEYVAFHFNAFKNFFLSFSSNPFLALLVLGVLSFCILAGRLVYESPPGRAGGSFGLRLVNPVISEKQEFLSWLSLLEKSPAA